MVSNNGLQQDPIIYEKVYNVELPMKQATYIHDVGLMWQNEYWLLFIIQGNLNMVGALCP